MAFEYIDRALLQRQQNQLQRQRICLPKGHGRHIEYGGQCYLNFSCNDYLAMASHPQVIAATKDALAQYGVGSGGSPLVTGFSQPQRELEDYVCQWLGYERCLLFNSGFSANTGVIQSLMSEQSGLLIQDKLNHASLIDAGIDCAAKSLRFRHNDMASLKQRLTVTASDKLVVTEGVFSMDGDAAPIKDIAQLSQAHDAWLMVDDAHGIGVLGEGGRGSVANAGLNASAVNIHMATFGKAVGTMGAVVGANSQVIEYLLQYCRHYIYSTAMPPAMAAATLMSLQCLAKEQWRREKLYGLVDYFKTKLAALGLPVIQSQSAIIPIIIGDAAKTMALSEQLKKSAIWLAAIRPPTVAPNSSRLRVTVTCHHEMADIDYLFKSMEPLL